MMKRLPPNGPAPSFARHGVVLLVMLSLLGLFTVIAVTFVVASGHFRRGAAVAARVEQYGDPFEVLLQQALMQVVRGSNHPQSVIGPHSLLEDMYGNSDSVAGVLQTFDTASLNETINNWSYAGGKNYKPEVMFIKVGGGYSFGWDKLPGKAYFDDNAPGQPGYGVVDDISEAGMGDDVKLGSMTAYPTSLNPNAAVVDNVDNYYAGRVITFMTGSAAGQSCYILRSKIIGLGANAVGPTVLSISPPENGGVPTDGDRYVINSRAFNGTGFGSQMPKSTTANNDLRMLNYEYSSPIDTGKYSLNGKGISIALTPNPTDAGYRAYLDSNAALIDADEDYDVADFQNMMLARQQYNSNTKRMETIAPSLHRPDLVNYFRNMNSAGTWTDIPPSVRRKIMLRVDPVDNYDYTQTGNLDPSKDKDGFTVGSDRSFTNPDFDAINGPWDVDNDGDGYPDSIWVDIGLPVTTAPDGRLIKPLVAVMVLDLDGRLNVNAHGSHKHYARTNEIDNVVDATQKNISGQWQGGTFKSPIDPKKNVYQNRRHVEYSTEERFMIGAKAVAYSQTLDLSSITPVTDPTIVSEIFPEYVTNQKWAAAYEYTSVYDAPGLRSRYWRVYQDAPATADNREVLPWIEPAFGQGYSVADVNLGVLLHSNGLAPRMGVTTFTNPNRTELTFGRYNVYRHLLEGTGDTTLPTPGRYGEQHLRRPESFSFLGMGDTPRAGATNITSTLYKASNPKTATDDNTPGLTNTSYVLGNYREQYNFNSYGDYGTPGDFDSNGAVGLDLAGQPIYLQMGTSDETVDEPTEINLHRRYYPQLALKGATNQGQRGNTAHKDAPFTPSELERVLRQRDPNSAAFSSRLYSLIGNYEFERFAYTSESWDVPCPHVAPTPELAGALRDLQLSVTHPSLSDLLRARFYLSHGTASPLTAAQTAQLATVSMRSFTYSNSSSAATQNAQRRQLRLLSPDLGMGTRMDVNAPFGNGQDDSLPGEPGYGVVDEPGEFYRERVSIDSGATQLNFDGNRDGYFVPSATATGANSLIVDEQARQQYAKELYCLMMLLIDQNYVMPLPIAFTGAAGTGSVEGLRDDLLQQKMPLSSGDYLPPQYANNYPLYAQHWLTARRIAQWAINAVDFRDRDSIMSSFEFDADPFFDNLTSSKPGTVDNILAPGLNVGTWDVDGNVNVPSPVGSDDSTKPWRGVVWGCEYADLLLTETLAFHDRRTMNTAKDNTVLTNSDALKTSLTGTYKLSQTKANGDVIMNDAPLHTVTDPIYKYDPHWDQVRVPQGSAFFELYATGNPSTPNAMRPAELYNTTGKLDLALTASDPNTGVKYPVWRLAITQQRVTGNQTQTINDVASRLAANPATCSLDPADPGFSLLPWVNAAATTTNQMVVIERVVGFCAAAGVTFTAGLNIPFGATALPQQTIDVFANYVNNVTVTPGQYVVVGPYRNNGTADHVTTIGRTVDTQITVTNGGLTVTSPNANIPPQPVISLNSTYGFVATSPDGSDEYPIYSTTSGRGNILGKGLNTSVTLSTPNYRQIREPETIACYSSGNLGGDAQQRPIGLNVSEPTNTDRPQVYSLVNNSSPVTLTLGTATYPNGTPLNAFDGITSNDPQRLYDDVPWDGYIKDASGTTVISNTQLPRIDDHTTLRYKSVFLQRLADPTRGWHRYTNPYITIDWMPIDLTVFNGEPWGLEATRLEHLRESGNNSLPRNSNNTPVKSQVRFGSRQRGAPRYPFKGNFSYLNLWGQPNYLDPDEPGGPPPDLDTRPPLTNRVSEKTTITTFDRYKLRRYSYTTNPGAPSTPPDNEFFVKWQDPLIHTLGYINESYHYRRRLMYGNASTTNVGEFFNPAYRVTDPTVRPDPRTQMSLGSNDTAFGWLMEVDFNPVANASPVPTEYVQYIGSPWRPFNWMTWNNRPYAGAMELMLVPASSPSRLLHEYDMRRTSLPSWTNANQARTPTEVSRSGNHYLPYIADKTMTVPGYIGRPPFGHLLNFFESSSAVGAGNYPETTPLDANNSHFTPANFFRLFEFVHVPSRFSGTRQAHFHSTLNNASVGTAQAVTGEPYGWPFTAPFNSIPRYREPGRVNINTVPFLSGDPTAVWRSVINDFYPTQRYPSAPGRFTINDTSDVITYTAPSNSTAGGVNTPNIAPKGRPPYNASELNSGSYHNLAASMQSDNPGFDPRGPDGRGGTGDELYSKTLINRHDSSVPALFSNPFRSYMSNYGAVTGTTLANSSNAEALLAVDSTLLRRRATTWNPWRTYHWPAAGSGTAGLDLASQVDPAFDPLFTLNFPRPYATPYGTPFSGYTAYMFYRWGVPNIFGGPSTVANVASPQQTSYGTPASLYDNYHSRDTDYRNTDRNPFFRYQLYTKLSNVVTTRSNCYAIWVTLGYFEVEQVKIADTTSHNLPSQESSGFKSSDDLPDAYRYPSGYRILREYGGDTGETQRHKAFALFDRTIPVGFLRGENLNVDRAFLTRRVLY